MSLTIEATYEDGVLKPLSPLPLKEHEKVRVTVEPQVSQAQRSAGMIGWTGTVEDFDRILAEAQKSEQLP